MKVQYERGTYSIQYIYIVYIYSIYLLSKCSAVNLKLHLLHLSY